MASPRRSNHAAPTFSSRGFTLIELLVVVAVIGVLAAVLLPALAGARDSALRTISTNNMRSLGIAILAYQDDYEGRYPLTSHGNPDLSSTWVYRLAPYLSDATLVASPDDPAESVWRIGDVRVCPLDPKADERKLSGGTSFLLNEFVAVPLIGPFGGIDWTQTYNRLDRIPRPSQTPVMFIGADRWGVSPTNEHTHSRSWTDWETVVWDIATDRFGSPQPDGLGGASNYWHADGRIEAVEASDRKALIDDGINFADPG